MRARTRNILYHLPRIYSSLSCTSVSRMPACFFFGGTIVDFPSSGRPCERERNVCGARVRRHSVAQVSSARYMRYMEAGRRRGAGGNRGLGMGQRERPPRVPSIRAAAACPAARPSWAVRVWYVVVSYDVCLFGLAHRRPSVVCRAEGFFWALRRDGFVLLAIRLRGVLDWP